MLDLDLGSGIRWMFLEVKGCLPSTLLARRTTPGISRAEVADSNFCSRVGAMVC